jgi:hypothetical protein
MSAPPRGTGPNLAAKPSPVIVSPRIVVPPKATSQTVDLDSTNPSLNLRTTDPLLLLPLRLETRFVQASGSPQLWVRIFPDQVAIDSHDVTLTAAEWAAAVTYWKAMWTLTAADTADQKTAWAALAAAFGPARAAYIASTTGPADFDTWVSTPGSGVLGTGRVLPTAPASARTRSWAQPAVARGLPTQWFVLLISGTTTLATEITRPKVDLAVSLDPGATGALNSATGTTAAMSWLSDFTQAQQVGMGVVIDLTAEQFSAGFDQVVVFGVTGDTGAAGQSAFEALLTAHRFTSGLAFVAQGTATKNSPDSVSGYTKSDPTFSQSFIAERSGPLLPTTPFTAAQLVSASCPDGQMFSGLLGIDPTTVTHTPGTDGTDQQDAVATATACWPATGDYFIRYLMGLPVAGMREDIRQFATELTRARGPIPSFRVGSIPYGVLPIVSLAGVGTGSNTINRMSGLVATLMQAMRPTWEKITQAFPLQVIPNAQTTPEQALANVLGRDASTVNVNALMDSGPQFAWNMGQWDVASSTITSTVGGIGLSVTNVTQPQLYAAGEALLAEVPLAQGLSSTQATALGWAASAGPASGFMYLGPLGSNLRHVTADGQVSETAELPATYFLMTRIGFDSLVRRVNVLEYMVTLSPSQLVSFVPQAGDLTLLMAVVRQALLLEYANAASIVLNVALNEPEEYVEPPGQQPLTFLWALAQTTYTPAAGLPAANGALGDYLQTAVQTTAGQTAFPGLAALLSAVSYLAHLSTAALERALLESLDVCGYRLDAWGTAVATATHLRTRMTNAQGLALGVWGYVENLRPAAATTLSSADLATLSSAFDPATSPSPSPVAPAKDTTGFIFAPSLTHAATGAVLRNGYLSNANGTYGTALAVDLSSARVRAGLNLLEGIRQGQPLGALLGYLFEQGLNQGGLQILLQAFRDAYPIVANKMAQSAPGPADAVAASNVVDGCALQGAWEAGTIPWGTGSLPASDGSDPNYTPVTVLLDLLSDRLDALSDIAVAESIFQVARGNPIRSGGALNTSSREQHPTEPQVVETPRSGLDLTQRVLSTFVVTPGAPPASTWLASTASSPRAAAEPFLEAWLCAVLPDPTDVQFQLQYTSATGGPPVVSGNLTLATMGLSALDLLSLVPPPPTGAAATACDGSELPGTELDRWILVQCLAPNGPLPANATNASVVYTPTTPPIAPLMTVPQLLVLVRPLQELIRSARPVVPTDFVPPAALVPSADLDLSGVTSRLATALGNLNKLATTTLGGLPATVTAANSPSALQALLSASAFGIPGAAPVTTAQDAKSLAALAAQVKTVLGLVNQRLATLTGDSSLYDSGSGSLVLLSPPSDVDLMKLAQRTAEAIFGPRFMVLPVVTPATTGTPPDPVATAVTNLAAGIAAWGAADHLPTAGVIQQLTHVRPPMARLDEVMTLSAVLSQTPVPDLAVAQLGGEQAYSTSNPWLAGPVSTRFPWAVGSPPASLHGSYALLDWTPPSLGAPTGASLCGLFFDEWVEQIPNNAEKPAISFHYSEPGSRAPKSLLLAAPPPTKDTWTAQLVRDVVLEAIALAKMRTVDPQTLESGSSVGQLLPALFAGWGPFTLSTLIPFLPTSTDPTGS